MIALVNWIVGSAFLILLSYIDFRTFNKDKGYIPSVLTTSFLIVAFLVNFPESIFSGILAGLLALLLTDLEYWGGIADFKVFVAAGMLFPNFVQASIFAGFVTFFGLIYKMIMRKVLKKEDAQIPFIPVIWLAFFVSFILFLVLLA